MRVISVISHNVNLQPETMIPVVVVVEEVVYPALAVLYLVLTDLLETDQILMGTYAMLREKYQMEFCVLPLLLRIEGVDVMVVLILLMKVMLMVMQTMLMQTMWRISVVYIVVEHQILPIFSMQAVPFPRGDMIH